MEHWLGLCAFMCGLAYWGPI